MGQRKGYYLLLTALLLFGLYLISPLNDRSSVQTTVSDTATPSEVIYQGVDGQDALTILKASHTVETDMYDFGEMVTSIDGVAGDNDHFWSFYVNGQPATVGAQDYQTKSTDTISWRLESVLIN